MPVKTVVCSICGETVSKRQTYLVDKKTGARACREHEETLEAKDKIALDAQIEAEKKQAHEDRREYEKRTQTFGSPEFFERSSEIQNNCWKCLVKGLKHEEFFMRQLVAMKKVSMREGGRTVLPIPFTEQGIIDCKKVHKAMADPLSDTSPIYIGNWPIPEEKEKETIQFIRKRFRVFAETLNMVQLCSECGDKIGYSIESLMPKFSPETFEKDLVDGAELHAAIEPLINLRALSEIKIENKISAQNN